ncbi:MAG: protein kinase [bacterium]
MTSAESPPERWARVRRIVEAMLELPAPLRQSFLEEQTSDDDALRREVERLARALESAGSSESFLAEPAGQFAAPLVAQFVDGVGFALTAALAGRYEIGRELGRGGMAIVYLAHDIKHDRQVALKLLNPELGAMLGGDRFLSEIRVTAHLHHPNLLPLFDSGDADGLLWYVMPYVEGGSLRTRLDREGQLSVDEAVRIAATVANALDYAHRHGVIHRDLKPENILMHEDQPLLADFGIALAVSKAGAERLTQRGVSVGTPQYMSPEQASVDREVDGRSDVYSLACVLYELLVGDPPHSGSSAQIVLAKVLSQPVLSARAVRPNIPAHVEAALERALAKVPADRFARAREFADALLLPNVFSATPSAKETDTASTTHRRRNLFAGVATAALVALGIVAWMRTRDREAQPARTSRFVVGVLSDLRRGSAPTLTPDGGSLVYTGPSASRRAVFVRPLNQLHGRPIAGTEDAVSAFVSPDGRWVGIFTMDDKLEKVPIGGGTPTVLGAAFRFSNASWAPSGVIVTDGYGAGGLSWLKDAGGATHALTRLDRNSGESAHSSPLVLPDGRSVVFTVQRRRGGPAPLMGEFAITTLDEQASTPASYVLLGVTGRRAVSFVDGWLVYTGSDGATIMAVKLDVDGRRVVGAPVVVMQDPDTGIDAVTLAANGTLVYTRPVSANAPVLVDENGASHALLGSPDSGAFMNPRLSLDGARLAIQGTSPQGSDIWVIDLASRTSTRLTTGGNSFAPAWMPDGRRIVFLSNRSGEYAFWWQLADGSAPAEKLVTQQGGFAGAVSPDGRTLVFQRQQDNAWRLWQAQLDGDRKATPLSVESFDEYMPAIAPDGHWLAYVSNASGALEIYVRPFPGPGAAIQISQDGGAEPVWSRDGHRVFYRSGHQLFAASVTSGPSFVVGARAPLFTDDFEGEMPHSNYDVTPDGKRFIMVAARTQGGPETVVVVNWLSELRAKLAGR